MSRVMAAMAIVQGAAGGIAIQMDTQESPAFVLAFTGLCVVAWCVSALLFRKASKATPTG